MRQALKLNAADLRDGDPRAVAMLCAARGPAVLEYCKAAVPDHAASSAVTAFASFRQRLVEAGEHVSPELETLLLSSSRDAVRAATDAQPAPQVLEAAVAAFVSASPRPVPPGLAQQIIHATIAAAPVLVDGGDVASVYEEAEQRYADAFTGDDLGQEELVTAAVAEAVAPDRWVPRQLSAPAAHEAEGERAVEEVESGADPDCAPDSDFDGHADADPAPEVDLAESPWLVAPDAPAPAGMSSELALRPPPPVTAEQPREPASGKQSRSSRRGRWAALAAALIIIGGAAAAVFATDLLDRFSDDELTLSQQPRTPFSAAGARFEVKVAPNSSWARELGKRDPRSGMRWVMIAVATRNISRADFRPLGLGYRLISSSGNVIGPETAMLRVASVNDRGQLRQGQRSSVHLGFQVPATASELTLAFEPGGVDSARTVRVPLGADG